MSETATELAQGAADGPAHAPGFDKHPNYQLEFLACPKRIRATFNGETIVDSTAALILRESRHVPVYYFPQTDVRLDLMAPTDHSTYCPFKGEASYHSLTVGDRQDLNVMWTYRDPYVEFLALEGHSGFYWSKMDAWFEEDEEVFVHARDPKVRIDILASSRPVRVVLAGRTVAQSTDAKFLFETGMPTRYYLPRADVEMDLLAPTERRTACPYKGEARYHKARIGEQIFEDIVWSYADPVRESAPIKDYLCFYNDRVDAIPVDGTPIGEPAGK